MMVDVITNHEDLANFEIVTPLIDPFPTFFELFLVELPHLYLCSQLAGLLLEFIGHNLSSCSIVLEFVHQISV